MPALHYKEPWAPWWIKLIFTVPYIPLAYAVAKSTAADGRYVILPPFVVLTYILFALLFNENQATISTTGVSTTLRPFPLGTGHTIPRAEIAHLYVAQVRVKKRGTVIEEIHSFGLATKDNQSIEIQSAYPSLEPALNHARQAQQSLNVELYTDNSPHPNPNFRRTFLLWFGLLVLATILGAVIHFAERRGSPSHPSQPKINSLNTKSTPNHSPSSPPNPSPSERTCTSPGPARIELSA